ncbi:MAG: tetratricopeptide repeat protein [Nitratireductor sp.]|nr:tetratricopeptide repeat protein [Nitratireductor sp.]MCB1457704.1 tetratricopeptide repeat protein [Nitratireductor sp.]
MRLFSFVLCLCLLSGAMIPVAALAADDEDVAETRNAATLDSLLGDLARQSDPAKAQRIARQVSRKWLDSGSETINLLMDWSARAFREKNSPLAEDLLTQVVTLAPDYAEGWNRRATLYYTQGNLGRSLADIERVLQLEPRHFGALSGLGSILQRTGSDRKALETYFKVLEIYPANRPAQKAVEELEEELSGKGA